MEKHPMFIDQKTLIKMPVLPKAIYRFKAIPIKTPMMLFAEIQNPNLKFKWHLKRISSHLNNLEKNKSRRLTFPDFKTYYETLVIKTVWYLHKDRHIHKWNRIESPQVNPYIYSQVILTRLPRPFNEENTFFNKYSWESWMYTLKRMKLDPYLMSCTTTISKQTDDLNTRLKTELLE